jgi:hypothetical protein
MRSSEDGYATPMALVISLAIALVATAVTARALTTLRLSRADLDRVRAESRLDGAQLSASLVVLAQTTSQRLSWDMQADAEPYEVIAEPEAVKLNAAALSITEDAALQALGAADPDRVRDQLKRASSISTLSEDDLALADPSPVWRGCAGSIISSYGRADKAFVPRAVAPAFPTDLTEGSRAGEIWRIRVADQRGWTDERIVRLTGQADHPTVILDRRFYRRAKGGDPCDRVFASLGG